jgi:hypothetical protein
VGKECSWQEDWKFLEIQHDVVVVMLYQAYHLCTLGYMREWQPCEKMESYHD